MTVNEYKRILKKGLRKVTLCFLVERNKILLAEKKVRFGKGKVIGVGGKLEKGEDVLKALKREIKEELDIIPVELAFAATVNFYFPYEVEPFREKETGKTYSWDQQVLVYLCRKWVGEPTESEELQPKWFSKDKVPFSRMWDDAKYWLPEILNNKKIFAEFLYGKDYKVEDYKMSVLKK